MISPELLDRPTAPPPSVRVPAPVERDPAPARAAGLCLLAALLFNFGIRGGVANVLITLGGVLILAVLLSDGRLPRAEARWLAAASVAPLAFLAVRVSPWLIMANVVSVVALVGLAIVVARSGTVFDTTPFRLLARTGPAISRAFGGVRILTPLVPSLSRETNGSVARIATAVGIVLPMLAVVVALLAAADPVFAGMIVLDVDPSWLLGHLALVLFFLVVGLSVIAAAAGDSHDERPTGFFGVAEVVTMLSLTAAVLGLFVVSQLVALTDAGKRLIETAGVTPADYARSGFFQLCWATAVLLVLLGVVRRLADGDALRSTSVRVIGAIVPLLALGLVVVSLRRLGLYDAAFGLTMLRLVVMAAAVWMGAVLVMVALRNGGVGHSRDWVTAGAGALALVLVLTANLVNVEAFVVRHNVDRADDGAALDVDYLSYGLSDDALPAIADAVDSPPPGVEASELIAALRCDEPDATGAEALNLAVARAALVRDRYCATASV